MIVPSQLPSRTPCRLAFVGEAPGVEEVARGRPLVGPSGRVFNAMLRTAGIDRSECFVGNVFGEKLPGNDVAAWCAGGQEARQWQEGSVPPMPPLGKAGYLRPEHWHHLKRLEEELRAAQPTVVVPLGATALWALTGSTEIGSARGAPQAATQLIPGQKLLPAYHPAFVLKQWKFYHVGVGDFIKAQREADAGPEVRHPHVRLLLEPTVEDLWAFKRERVDGAGLLSIDIETGWGQITCFGVSADAEVAICCPFVDLRQPDRSYWRTAEEEQEAWRWVREVCEGPEPKLGQNFTYDAFWLLDRAGVRCVNYREDTRLEHHALYPELPKALGFMAGCYTPMGPWKLMNSQKEGKGDD